MAPRKQDGSFNAEWDVKLCSTCFEIPGSWCYAFWCPPCVSFMQRKKILNNDMSSDLLLLVFCFRKQTLPSGEVAYPKYQVRKLSVVACLYLFFSCMQSQQEHELKMREGNAPQLKTVTVVTTAQPGSQPYPAQPGYGQGPPPPQQSYPPPPNQGYPPPPNQGYPPPPNQGYPPPPNQGYPPPPNQGYPPPPGNQQYPPPPKY
eukprot:Nk52_evm21s2485 gene=Nk52_evmTU21s2485